MITMLTKKYCRLCGDLLTSENWYPSAMKKNNYICNECTVWKSNRVENGIKNIDYVVCYICEQQLLSLSNHLHIHNITKEEYLKLYPDSLLVCEVSQQRRSKNRSRKITVECDNCGNDITRRPSAINDRNFCDRTCKNEYRKKLADKKWVLADKERDNWVKDNQNKHLCKCGCGNFIVILPSHYYNGISDFISGHNMKTDESRIAARKRAKNDIQGIQRLNDASDIYWSNEENCKRRSDEVSQYHIDHPEAGDIMSEHMKNAWGKLNDDERNEWCEKLSAGQQGIPYDEWEKFISGNDWRDWDKAIYLNEWFQGCHRHHITETLIICIPVELHRHIWHNLKTGQGMAEMNMLALQYMNGCYND